MNEYNRLDELYKNRIAALEAEVAELRKDKERLDYLGTHDVAVEEDDNENILYCVSRDDGFWAGRLTIREAIDAAKENQ